MFLRSIGPSPSSNVDLRPAPTARTAGEAISDCLTIRPFLGYSWVGSVEPSATNPAVAATGSTVFVLRPAARAPPKSPYTANRYAFHVKHIYSVLESSRDTPGETKIFPARASRIANTNSVPSRGLTTYAKAPADRPACTKSGS